MYSLFLHGLSEHIIKTLTHSRLEMHCEPLIGVNVAKQIMLHSYRKICARVGCGWRVSQLQHPSSDQDLVQAKTMTVTLVSPLTVTTYNTAAKDLFKTIITEYLCNHYIYYINQ